MQEFWENEREMRGWRAEILGVRLDRAQFVFLLSFSLVWTLKVVSICRSLLQSCVWDVFLFMGDDTRLEKVGHKEDHKDRHEGTL